MSKTVKTETVLCDCGHVPSDRGQYTTGYGIDSKGKTHCYTCCHKMDMQDVQGHDRPVVGYLSCDGKTIDNWSGWVIMRVVATAPCKLTRASHTHDSSYHSVWCLDVFGRRWYGRGSSGILIKMRPIGA